jgi:NADH:ubiquinone oxidoreductase subunit E
MNDQVAVAEDTVQGILTTWKSKPAFLVEILQDIQEEYHYLPREVLEVTAEQLHVPMTQIYHIATFFKGLSLEPRGKHVVQVCMGTACHVQGSPKILAAFERELEIEAGSTTKDMEFGLEAVRCLGCCGLAAVVTVDKNLHGQVKSTGAKRLLKKYKS